MNFEDEHYVRIYTRRTKTVKKWGWEGRVLFREIMTVVDKAGVLDDIEEPFEDVALMTELPEEVVRVGLPKLLESGTVELRGRCLVVPNYLDGQTASKSDRNRAKESRQRRSASARLEQLKDANGNVTERTGCDDDVTNRDDGVTERSKTLDERPAASPNAETTQRSTTQYNATQYNATQEQRSDLPTGPIPCPEDLTLAEPQIKSLECSGDMIPRWAIELITEHVVPNWASDPLKMKTLAEWRTYLRATIKNRWKDPKTRPKKPAPASNPVEVQARLRARQEAEDAADEAHRRKLLAQHSGPTVTDLGALLQGVG